MTVTLRRIIFGLLWLGIALHSVQAFAQDPEYRLKLAKARLYLESDQLDRAQAIIEELKAVHPGDPDVVVLQAEASQRLGNQRRARELINQAAKLRPESQDIQKRKRELNRTSMVSAEREVELTGDSQVEQITRAEGRTEYEPFAAIGVRAESDKVRLEQFRRVNGTIGRLDEDRVRAEFYHDYIHDGGNQSRFSFYVADGVVGAGGRYAMLDSHGKTTVALALQQPEWDYVEGVLDEGAIDTLSVERVQRLNLQTTGTLLVGINRYSIDDESDVARSLKLDGGVTYLLPQREQIKNMLGQGADVSLNYWVAAEYADDKETALDSTGTRFELYPVESHEFHIGTLYVSKEFARQFKVNGYGGFVYDRIGDQGPHFGGTLDYYTDDGLRASLFASRSVSSEGSNDTYDRVGANISWDF